MPDLVSALDEMSAQSNSSKARGDPRLAASPVHSVSLDTYIGSDLECPTHADGTKVNVSKNSGNKSINTESHFSIRK